MSKSCLRLLEKMDFKKIVKILGFFMYPILLFLWNVIITLLGVYDSFPWLDIPMHFIGGIAVGYSFFLTLNYLQERDNFQNKKIYTAIFGIALVSLIAVFWEFYEFGMDYFFGLNYQTSVEDTMLDFFLGILGGVFMNWILFLKKG